MRLAAQAVTAMAAVAAARAVVLCLTFASCLLSAVAPYTDAKPLVFKGAFDPWKVLELPRSQSLPANDVLKKAFKKAALKWHPDRCKRTTPIEECETRMEEVKLAQDVLSDDRRLQQWEAWDEDRRGGGPRRQGQRSKPFGEPRMPGQGQQRPGQWPGGGGGFNFDFGGGGPSAFGGGKQRPPRPRPGPPPRQRSPAPSPTPSSKEKRWRVVSTETSPGPAGATIEVVTRERPLPDTPMIQVEVLEKTCYKAQVQCQEKVLERRRRRREDHEKKEL